MKVLTIAILALLLAFAAFAQAPDTIWTNVFSGSSDDEFISACQTSDGGYICIGKMEHTIGGDDDLWMVKTDAAGNQTWQMTLGGNDEDDGSTVFQTSDGGYIICGSTDSYGAGESDIWLVKTNPSGDTTWTKTYGGSGDESGGAMARASGGGYVMSGSTDSFGAGEKDIWLVKVNDSGDTLWTRTIGSAINNEGGAGIMPTPDGGYIIACYTDELMPTIYIAHYLLKVDANGIEQWHTVHQAGAIGYIFGALPTSGGGYLSIGYSMDLPGQPDCKIFALKTDASGQEIWRRFYGDSLHAYYSIGAVPTPDGCYLLSGQKVGLTPPLTYSFMVMKISAAGDVMYEYTLPDSLMRLGCTIASTNDGNYIIAGYTTVHATPENHTEGFLAKFSDGEVLVKNPDRQSIGDFHLYPPHPNPFNASTVIAFELKNAGNAELTVFDINGKEVTRLAQGYRNEGLHLIEWNAHTAPSGVYFARLTAGDFTQTRKLLLLK